MGFNLDDYEPVASRLARWINWAADRNLQPRVVTHLVHYTDDRCVFRAELYTVDLNNGVEVMHATGWAEETRGDGNVNRTSHLENCESSSVGRALANAGLAGSDPSKRPSREEMGKVVRAGGTPSTSSGGMATPAQAGFIRKLLANRGIGQEHEIQAKIDEALGTEVLFSQLTTAQASKVIEYLKSKS